VKGPQGNQFLPGVGAFPAPRAGNRAFRSNSSQKGRRPFCSGISAAIPCAAQERHPCRSWASEFCFAKLLGVYHSRHPWRPAWGGERHPCRFWLGSFAGQNSRGLAGGPLPACTVKEWLYSIACGDGRIRPIRACTAGKWLHGIACGDGRIRPIRACTAGKWLHGIACGDGRIRPIRVCTAGKRLHGIACGDGRIRPIRACTVRKWLYGIACGDGRIRPSPCGRGCGAVW
jgi:hypothetical protein